MAKIIYEFDYHEDRDLIDTFKQCENMSMALYEIYNKCRSELKHGDEELSQHIENLLEEIKEISGQFM